MLSTYGNIGQTLSSVAMLAQVPEGITPVGYITHGQTHRLVRVSPEETRYANATTVGRAAASPVAHSPSPAVLRLPGPAPCGALSPRAAETTTSDLPDQRRSSRGSRATHTAGLMADAFSGNSVVGDPHRWLEGGRQRRRRLLEQLAGGRRRRRLGAGVRAGALH